MANSKQQPDGLAGSSLPSPKGFNSKLLRSLIESGNKDSALKLIMKQPHNAIVTLNEIYMEHVERDTETSEIAEWVAERISELSEIPLEGVKEGEVFTSPSDSTRSVQPGEESSLAIGKDTLPSSTVLNVPPVRTSSSVVSEGGSTSLNVENYNQLSSVERKYISKFLDYKGLKKHLRDLLKAYKLEGDPDKLSKLQKEVRLLLGETSKEQNALGEIRTEIGVAINDARQSKAKRNKQE